MKRVKLLKAFFIVMLSLFQVSILNAKETLHTECSVNNSIYNLMGGFEIYNGKDVYVFKATTKSLSKVALFKSSFKSDGSLNKFKCVKKYSNFEFGHANDCCIYNNEIFVAPYGRANINGKTFFYDNGGLVDGTYYPIVSVCIKNDYSVKGYKIVDSDGEEISDKRIGGICYLNDKTYDGYPVFCLKGVDNKIMLCYLKENLFHTYFSCTIIRPPYSQYGNRDQGVSYKDGDLYFGLGVLNEKQQCGAVAYICKIKLDDLMENKPNNAYAVYSKDLSNKFKKFEIETIAFLNDTIFVNVNGQIIENGKSKGEDAIYSIKL